MTRRKPPDRGDIVWLEFSPQSGHERAGRRPALVLSPASYNAAAGLALVCPITSGAKGYPFEVPLDSALGVSGVVLADAVRSVDWHERKAKLAGRAPAEVIETVRARLQTLI